MMAIWSILGMLETFNLGSNNHIHSDARNNNDIYVLKKTTLFCPLSNSAMESSPLWQILISDFMNTKDYHPKSKQLFFVPFSLLLLIWIPFNGLITKHSNCKTRSLSLN